ncbi:hypothetical protein DFS34DRAFT_672500 [Phlyctochytrium arcticum]|nr:hypothetical protein DFS34DRAFT_672500 [Phlyctochytrium arcticum]
MPQSVADMPSVRTLEGTVIIYCSDGRVFPLESNGAKMPKVALEALPKKIEIAEIITYNERVESSSAGGGPQQQHLLSLKVMRLSRPSFVSVNFIPFEDRPDFPAHAALVQAAKNDITAPFPLPPQTRTSTGSSSGFIGRLSETFSSYLCINDESGHATHDVGMKAELQTGSQRFENLYAVTPKQFIREFWLMK